MSPELHREITNKVVFDYPKKSAGNNEKKSFCTRFIALEKTRVRYCI